VPAEPRRSQAVLLAWAASIFALSAVSDLRVLSAASVAAFLLFRRGALREVRRVVVGVAPFALGLSATSWCRPRPSRRSSSARCSSPS
jgi:hypothetical protein